MSEPRVHALLVTYQRPDDLARSLTALAGQSRPADRVVVVNNDAADVRPAVETAAAPVPWTVVDAGSNLGPAGGIALGMETILGAGADDEDLVLILDDDDPLVDTDVVADLVGAWTAAAVGGARPLGGVGLCGACLNRWTGRLRRRSCPPDPVADVDYLKSDWAPVYRVGAIRAVGPFRADLFFGFDDLEFGLRLANHGYRLQARSFGRNVGRDPPPASARYGRSPWRTYYTTRNLVEIYRREASTRLALQTMVLLGVVKPVVNLARHPLADRGQPRMAVTAVIDAVRGRMGRTVPPQRSKHHEP